MFSYEQMKNAGWTDEQLLANSEYAHLVPFNDTDLKTDMEEYDRIDARIKMLQDEKNNIREKVAKHMHQNKVNECIFTDAGGKDWKFAYQTRITKSINHTALIALIGQDRYSQIISEKESSSLVIREASKSSKSKTSSKTTNKPVEESINNSIQPISAPIGTLG